MLGSIPGQGRNLRQVSLHLIAYVDPALIGYLDVRSLASCILRTWRHCGVVDVSYVQGSVQALIIIHCQDVSPASEQGVGCLEGHISLTALQPCTLSL